MQACSDCSSTRDHLTLSLELELQQHSSVQS